MTSRVLVGLLGAASIAVGCAQSPPMVDGNTASDSAREPSSAWTVQQSSRSFDPNRPLEQRRDAMQDQDDERARSGDGGRRVGPPDRGDGGRRVGPPDQGDGGRRVGPPRDDDRRVGPPDRRDDDRRVGPPSRRMERPNWWGRRAWWGRGARPIWWGTTPYVSNRYILIGGLYYPFIVYGGFYYPDYSSPHIFANGLFIPFYEARQPMEQIQNPIPIGAGQIVTVQSERWGRRSY